MRIIILILIILIFIITTFLANRYKQILMRNKDLELMNHKFEEIAYKDILTGLQNKTVFLCKAEEFSQEAFKNLIGAVIYVDIDNFRKINEYLGNEYGDKVLIELKEVMGAVLKDNFKIFRWSGDEFVILVYGISEKSILDNIIKELIEIITSPFEILGKEIYITVSIGICVTDKDSKDIMNVVNCAEMAMYKAKSKGKGKYEFYNKNLYEESLQKYNIEEQMHRAIEKNEFDLYYQPQFSIIENKIRGFEALLRWNNTSLGNVSIGEVIKIAEDNGYIIKLGRWILRSACIQNKAWISKGFNYIISVNVSAVEFNQSNFYESVKSILEEVSYPPEFLEIEITETAFLKSFERTKHTIEQLNALGVGISLDDFGTGYSSLSYLKNMPIKTLKIDKGFIDDMLLNENNKCIVEGIIKLAHAINLEVIAEGVESKLQKQVLSQMNCDSIQGYYYSKPLNREDAEKYIQIFK